jgi:hypothetical protein
MNREDNLFLSTALLIFAGDKVQSALKPIAYNKNKMRHCGIK